MADDTAPPVVKNKIFNAKSEYHGGLTAVPNGSKGSLAFINGQIGICRGVIKTKMKMWVNCQHTAKVVVGSETGAINSYAKGWVAGGETTATVEVHLNSGEVAYFTVAESPIKVKAAIAPWLARYDVPLEASV
jgi:hypothetical protein